MRLTPSLLLLVLLAGAATVLADGPASSTLRAFQDYADAAIARFEARVTRSIAEGEPAVLTALRAGQIVAAAGGGDGILDVDGGLIHHWRARVRLPGLSLERVLAASKAYDTYPSVFRPIVAARVLAHEGDDYRVLFRMHASAGGLSATMDMRSAIHHVRVDAHHAYVVSRSEEIRQIEAAGTRRERALPPGEGSGYLWRAGSMTRWVEEDGAVWMDMETLALSRPFPRAIGWLIEPIARRLGRRSAETSEDEFRRALLSPPAR